ncbi:mannosylglycoprotein endo-beta-mannosidase [Trifolium repens]|nr:mannosylglycoprotein endo-beta-mannosidase [Trifolium repens]
MEFLVVYFLWFKSLIFTKLFNISYFLDVTNILHPDGNNLLAVLVHPPDHPGSIPPKGGQGGDHEIGKDMATQYVQGWDWIAPISTISYHMPQIFLVSIVITGPVKIIVPHLVSCFFDNYKRVYLHATTELENRSSWTAECSLSIHVTTELEGSIHLVEQLQTQNISVPAKSQLQYTFPELFFYKPDLWWPNGIGKQSLYNVNINIDVKGFGESDSWSHYFGLLW